MSALGFNTGYIEEIYRQYRRDPESVSESWRDFFEDYQPGEAFVAASEARGGDGADTELDAGPAEAAQEPSGNGAAPEAPPAPPTGDGAPADIGPVLRPASAPESAEEGAEVKTIRGVSSKIVENMEDSLGVPTATSVRSVPVKLLAENRQLLNGYQRQVGGDKVSYTHLIAWALVRGIEAFPDMNATYRRTDDGEHRHIQPAGINLGLAIDIEKRGKRQLLVPNVKDAGSMSFAQFLGVYNDLIKRARSGDLGLPDFAGTTATLTNPGMIGTKQSVPRLMPGQGVIVGVGAIGYPAEYAAFPPAIVARTGISQVMEITSTYDHRVIQGAVSGAFLKHVSELLLGEHGFYEGVFADLGVPYAPFKLQRDTMPQLGRSAEQEGREHARKQAAVLQLIRAFRVRGHLYADVNPLGYDRAYHPELDPATYGLTIWDLDRTFLTGGLGAKDELPLRDILATLRETYTRHVGVEYMHLSDPEEKRWLQERFEPTRGHDPLSKGAKRRIMEKLGAAEAFERFLHTKYIGHKRFSLEGGETIIPMLDALLSDAAEQEVEEVVIGMAHRGRLNVLANLMSKPYRAIFSEFEGNLDPSQTQGSGDVKYHLGARGTHEAPSGATTALQLASNPSHLEAVNPIVEGMVRAKQEMLREENVDAPGGDYFDAVLPLLIHGDAAFAGQGVVSETLNLSQLRGYRTGGTLHLVINNQIGFTTLPGDARSSTYATDIARMIQAPIFHVNGDDPEACVRVMRLALDYRQVFNKDVVVDLLCYRVHGHNEGDEPTFTQPLLYDKIEAKRSPRKLYTESLLRRGQITPEEAEAYMDSYRDNLQRAFEETKDLKEKSTDEAVERLASKAKDVGRLPDVETHVAREDLEAVVNAMVDIPEAFHTHRKLARSFKKRRDVFEKGKIDWAFGEALAFGTLLVDGTNVRMSGQDSRRGTFSQRHAVLVDQESGDEYIPLNNVRDDQAKILIYDSLLSEYAACGFEYGYSVADPDALVLWEAQFGDFSNGAQIVFDQFLSAAEAKWGQTSSLVLLLPHGYEGQGPEHSSARLERFLQLCAENNMVVGNFTTPANYFHALRRQVKWDAHKPLVVMTPKSLLRHPMAVSKPEDFTDAEFQPLIPADADPENVERLLFCSGKVYYDLLRALQDVPDEQRGRVAIARIEQLYPFPEDEVRKELERYSGAEHVVWVQEEPANMGAWTYLRYHLDDLFFAQTNDCTQRVAYAGRPAMASPATGSAKVHALEQQAIVTEALGL